MVAIQVQYTNKDIPGGALRGGLSDGCLERVLKKAEGKEAVGDDDILDRSNCLLAFALKDTNELVAAAANTYTTQIPTSPAYNNSGTDVLRTQSARFISQVPTYYTHYFSIFQYCTHLS